MTSQPAPVRVGEQPGEPGQRDPFLTREIVTLAVPALLLPGPAPRPAGPARS